MALQQQHQIAEILGTETLTLFDVGSRGGAPRRWRRIAPLVHLIAADHADTHGTAGSFASVQAIDGLLLDAAQQSEFHLTRNPKLSSIYRPNSEFLDLFERSERADVLRTEVLLTRTVDDVCQADSVQPDVLKLDTQGSELKILAGATRALQGISAVEIEVEFRAIYRDQPLFPDVDAFLVHHGFTLVDWMTTARWQRRTPGGLRTGLGELVDADALYVRLPEHRSEVHTTAGMTRRYVASMFNYGRFELIRDLLARDSSTCLDGLSRRTIASLCDGLERRLTRSRRLSEIASAIGSLQQHRVSSHLEY